MSRRLWIIVVSVAAHIGVGVALFASGIWKLDRLETSGVHDTIGVLMMNAEEGSPPPAAQQKPKLPEPKHIAKGPVQPTERPKDTPPTSDSTTSGNGTNPDAHGMTGDGTGDAPCTENCAPIASITVPVDVPVVKQVRLVAPNVLDMNRISGKTQIEPDYQTKLQMIDDHKLRVVATFKVCIDESGSVSSASLLASTKYSAYDGKLADAVRRWRYRPLMVNGEAYAACAPVTFVYNLTATH
jgi:TonB family protein